MNLNLPFSGSGRAAVVLTPEAGPSLRRDSTVDHLTVQGW